MNTLLKYPGGKWRIADWILSFFPKHKVYCEPFFGSGAIFFNKQPSYLETINDINSDIVNLFEVCRKYPEQLATAINLTPFSREEFIRCYEKSDDVIEQARRTVVRFHQSFGTSNSSKRSWKYAKTPGGPRVNSMWNYLPDTVIEVCERLKEAQIENIDALTLIKQYDSEDTLLYLDPPYLQSLRKKQLYKDEMTDKQHIELLEIIKETRSKVILSGYDNSLYDTYLSKWNTAEKITTAQMGLHRVEKLWFNFDPVYQLQLKI